MFTVDYGGFGVDFSTKTNTKSESDLNYRYFSILITTFTTKIQFR